MKNHFFPLVRNKLINSKVEIPLFILFFVVKRRDSRKLDGKNSRLKAIFTVSFFFSPISDHPSLIIKSRGTL